MTKENESLKVRICELQSVYYFENYAVWTEINLMNYTPNACHVFMCYTVVTLCNVKFFFSIIIKIQFIFV